MKTAGGRAEEFRQLRLRDVQEAARKLPPLGVTQMDEVSSSIQTLCQEFGLNRDSEEFQFTILLASQVLMAMAKSLRDDSQESDKDIGCHYILEATKRLEVAALWHTQWDHFNQSSSKKK